MIYAEQTMQFFRTMAILLAAACAAIAADGALTLVYTGRTLGYFRSPDIQGAGQQTCERSAANAAAEKFLHEVSDNSQGKLLLSMGDNFGPDLYARMLGDAGHLTPKDQQKVPPDFDNVGCFLRLAGFAATVPGREDFYFGAQRLRQLAKYLATPAGELRTVAMLAVNLQVETRLMDPPDKVTKPAPPLNYGAELGDAAFALPKKPLPYMRRFVISNGVRITRVTERKVERAGSQVTQQQQQRIYTVEDDSDRGLNTKATNRERVVEHVWVCPGELPRTFEPKPACVGPDNVSEDGTSLEFRRTGTGRFEVGRWYACASKLEKDFSSKDTMCRQFEVAQPFFNEPYTLSDAGDSAAVLFGVVDPQLLDGVGELNYSWRNKNKQYSTLAATSDPVDALRQALDLCDADAGCGARQKIVLAQMPPGKVEQLARHLRNRVQVIVGAADRERASVPMEGDLRIGRTPLILTPRRAFLPSKPNRALINPTQTDLRFQGVSVHVHNMVLSDSDAKISRPRYHATDSLIELISGTGNVEVQRDKNQNYNVRPMVETAVLDAMRRHCHADVAMLQQRDLFDPAYYGAAGPEPDQLQTLTDELLWKGDLLRCRPLTGAAIKAVLARSDELEARESDEFSDDEEHGRAVRKLGVFKDEDTKAFVINGKPVDDKRLYLVATTDFLSAGDTGYEALKVPPVPEPSIFKDTYLYEISSLFCESLKGTLSGATCRPPISSADYFDDIEASPAFIPKGLNAGGKLTDWTSQNWLNHNLLASARPDEKRVQNRPVIEVRLDRADFGFQGNLHSLTEAQLQDRFSGVQPTEASAPEKTEWTFDWLVRAQQERPEWQPFAQSDAAFDSIAIRQVFKTKDQSGNDVALVNEPYALSRSKNLMGFEAGMTGRLIPRGQKNTTGLKLLTSVRLETELASPFVLFKLSDGFDRRPLPRKNALFGKVGLRYEGKQSWVESGVQYGRYQQIQELKLGGTSCKPSDPDTCLSSDANKNLTIADVPGLAFSTTAQGRRQSGLFLNARVHVPLLLDKFDYVIENAGNFYLSRTGDLPNDTRYFDVLTNSLTIPVIGNFSLVPKVELFLFENQVNRQKVHGYQTSVTVQYRFDWHGGLRKRSILQYASPEITQ